MKQFCMKIGLQYMPCIYYLFSYLFSYYYSYLLLVSKFTRSLTISATRKWPIMLEGKNNTWEIRLKARKMKLNIIGGNDVT